MHPLYDEAIRLTDKLKELRLAVVGLSSELSKAEYDLALVKAKVERGLIKKVGDERKLGTTVEARARVFTLALDADDEYKSQLALYHEIKAKLDETRVEVSALQERLNIMLAVMKARESEHSP